MYRHIKTEKYGMDVNAIFLDVDSILCLVESTV